MAFRILLALILLSSGAPLGAQATAGDQCTTAQNCPRPSDEILRFICANVSTRLEVEDGDSPFLYEYERTLWEMVGARPGVDTEQSARRKIRMMWSMYRDAIICDDAGLRNGGILKYGIQNNFDYFVRDLVQNLGLDINFRDRSDRLTVLDYARGEIQRLSAEQTNNVAQIRELQRIHDWLRQHGAKYASELPAAVQ